ncbi:NUDIX domain-containing protein [Candidatus Shapirobacteria bacterium]|nr:NUDIX domain-containing protein [Candidatus Shapirobacteria bacterium]
MKPRRLPFEEFKYIYQRVPRLCVEVVIKTSKGILLTLRDIPPFQGYWHLPGGTVLLGETLEGAVKRFAQEEVGLRVKVKEFLGVIEYSKASFGQTIGLAYLISATSGKPKIDFQAKKVKFFKKIPKKTIPEQIKFLNAWLK